MGEIRMPALRLGGWWGMGEKRFSCAIQRRYTKFPDLRVERVFAESTADA